LKGAKEHGKQGKNAWKDSMHKGIEEAICHHPFLSKLKNLVLVVSDVSGQTVRALVSQLEIRPTQGHVENSWKIVASKEQVGFYTLHLQSGDDFFECTFPSPLEATVKFINSPDLDLRLAERSNYDAQAC